jgi:single-strand DNA-binding protein
MNDLNSVLVEGNLTRDPVLAATPRGTPVCNFSVASNRYYRVDNEKQQEVSFFDVETWSNLAQRCGDELEKGRGVRIVGRLKQDRWSDKEGNPRSRTKIVADHVEFRRPRPQPESEEPGEGLEDADAPDMEAVGAETVDVEDQEALAVF